MTANGSFLTLSRCFFLVRFLVDLSRIHCDVTLGKRKRTLVQETAPSLGSVRLISIS